MINQNNPDTRANPVNFAGAYWYYHYGSQYLHVEGQLNKRAIVRVRCLCVCGAREDILVLWFLFRQMSVLKDHVSIYFWANLLNVHWTSLKLSMTDDYQLKKKMPDICKQCVHCWWTFKQNAVRRLIYARRDDYWANLCTLLAVSYLSFRFYMRF